MKGGMTTTTSTDYDTSCRLERDDKTGVTRIHC